MVGHFVAPQCCGLVSFRQSSDWPSNSFR
jgi:hypothetical protein